MIYYDKNGKKIRQGDILDFDFGQGHGAVDTVRKQDGELGLLDFCTGEFVPLSQCALEYAELKRPFRKKNVQKLY